MGVESRPNQFAVEAAVSKFEEHERLLSEDAKADIDNTGRVLLGTIMMQIKHLTDAAQRIQRDMAEGKVPSVKMHFEIFRDLEPRDAIDGCKQRGPSVYQLTILDYKNAERDI
jgi:hypothetical protein